MISIDFNNECCGCSACSQICPQECIKMRENSEGFLIPQIDFEKCVSCNLCEKVCPVLNSETENLSDETIPKNVYAIYNKNEDIRLKSSSGGIFSLLAEYTIRKKGVVFGAKFSDDFKYVYHCMIEKEEDIAFFRGSKYIQSNINNTYKEVRNQLEKERFVLFSGTPCQVEGLRYFLRKEYDNLFLADLICHGVPSPKVWRKYLEHIENKYGKPKTVLFREKSNGWKGGGNVYITLQNNETHIDPLECNLYSSTFCQNLSLRNSCYECNFRKANRGSDVTIGDFWGIDSVAPELNDNKGISAVIMHSPKAKRIFEELSDQIVYSQVDFKSIEKNNLILKQPDKHKNRNKFYEALDKVSFDKNVKKNIPRHSAFIKMSYKIVKVCLKKILGDKNFNKLKMRLKNI